MMELQHQRLMALAGQLQLESHVNRRCIPEWQPSRR